MKKYMIILMILFGSIIASAQNVNKAQVEQKISQVAAKMKTMQADFVQTKYLKMLNEKMVSRGNMYYQQSDKLRWEYTSPYSYVFIMNGNQVSMRTGNRHSVIDVRQNKMFKEIARIMMNSVVGKSLSDSNDFKVSLSEKGAAWVAVLTPMRKNLQQMFQKIILNFNTQTSMVSRIEIYEKNGDKTVIDLKNVHVNGNISTSQFAIH